MIAAVWVVLALCAAGFGVNAWKYQQAKDTGSASSGAARTSSDSSHAIDENPVPTCRKQPVFCTQEYRPKTCSLKASREEVSASGSNGCQASQAVLAKLCAAGIASLTQAQWKSLSCKDD